MSPSSKYSGSKSKTSRKKSKGKPNSKQKNFHRFKNHSKQKHHDQAQQPPYKETEAVKHARLRTEEALTEWLIARDTSQHSPMISDSESPPMDSWQKEALDSMLRGENVVVDAPTTAGKTRVVEEFFKINVGNPSFRAAYTAPVKSLSNDKMREFSEMFGRENVGIATGDIKENLNAPIVVATLESYRNSLLGVEPDLGRSLVVFDEYHFMQDSGRGSAWEEAIILSPPSCQLLLLSASVDNAEEFCSWIESLTHRPCRLVRVKERPVPLENIVFYQERWLKGDEVKQLAPRTQIKISRFPLEHHEIARRLKNLPKLNLTPCIIYAGRRLSCENLAMEICNHLELLPKVESKKIHKLLEEDEVENVTRFMKPNLRRMLIMYGVGYHHSGIAPQGRRAIEVLVKQGALQFCVATMGLSIGINFSVRSTLISDYRRPGESGFTQYTASEVLQMLGRAGRRGKDLVGFSLWPSVQSFYKFSQTTRDRCTSRLKNDPTTFLGLVGRGFKLKDIENFYKKSFLGFANRNIDFSLLRQETLRKALGEDKIPCQSPAHEVSLHIENLESKCDICPIHNKCHDYINHNYNGSVAALHVHLHSIGCLDNQDKLSPSGSIARYFPQGGGLLIASMIDAGTIREDNLLACLELMACLSLARFKEPGCSPKYRFPFDADQIEEQLQEFYPLELFEELYDPPSGRRNYYLIREFNPDAGYAVNEWLRGSSWISLRKKVCHEKFAEGDLVALLYRSATYLQSLAQAGIANLSVAARALRDEILREPLMPSPSIKSEGSEEHEENQESSPIEL